VSLLPAAIVLAALAVLVLVILTVIRARHARWAAEEELMRLGGGFLQVQEAERARIARELHDDISQQLAVVALELDALETGPPDSASQRRARVSSLAQRVRSVAADLQQVTHALYPARLEHLGLVPAVRALGRDMEHHGVCIDVSEAEWPSTLPSVVALSLYRVAQEALHNSAKHSGTDVISVTFRGEDSSLTLTISDAGVGFDPQSAGALKGFGMVSMRQRLRTIGGSLSVRSAPGRGTRVQARLPRRVPLSEIGAHAGGPEGSIAPLGR
jgi:signal transduction histidine kinase